MQRYFLALLLFAFCVSQSHSAKPMMAKDDTLRMGCVAFAKEATSKAFRQIRSFLAKGLGRDIKLTLYPNYHEVIHDLANDNIDVAVLSPLVYLNARSTCALNTLAYGIYRSSGGFTYKSVILVPRESKAKKLTDLAGKKMAYVDIMSVSGYVLPKAALKKVGLSGKKKMTASFHKNHVDAVFAVLRGKADAVSTYDIIFKDSKKLANSRRKLRRLWTSNFVIPSDAFVTTKRVPFGLRKKLRTLLLSYFAAQDKKEADRNELYEGFVPGDPNLYKDLQQFMTEVRAKRR